MDHRASISNFISQLTNFVSQHVPVVGSHFFPCYKCSIQPELFEEMKNWYCQQPINTFSSTQFNVSALYHALLHERRETRIGCLIRMSETFLGELMQQCNTANSVQSRDMLQIALDILKDSRSPSHRSRLCLKENAAPVYAPPPPPTPSTPLTIIYENETTPLQTDPMWSNESAIPVRVATKRREESLPQWVSKTAKYEQVSPVKNNLYNLSEEEMGAFFQAM
ncbi:Hypothetical predicted protein [Mytilus galloprovincialis]|nr:Hypothetical predicted protein [Mytilus galloprovincialis]